MPDAEFEKTFADLAHARLRDRAPGLLDHLVGFQLLDKSDDDTHAVGVWGFKVGPEWIYAPSFFLNGQLKGDELLYIKSQDAFVPLKENWVNYLLNRRPHVLGETEEKKQNELGIMQPDFDVMARPPYMGSKYASDQSGMRSLVDWMNSSVGSDFRGFMPVVVSGPGDAKYASLDSKWNLPAFIRGAGKRAAVTLFAEMKKNAAFAEALLRFYDINDLVKAAEAAIVKTALEKRAADGDKIIQGTAPRVKVIFADRQDPFALESANLTDGEKEKLQRDRYLVKDRRGSTELGTVYHREIAKTLQRPSTSGYCRLMTRMGTMKPHLVILNPVGDNRRTARRLGDAVAINLDAGNRMTMISPKSIFSDSVMHDKQGWDSKFEGLPAADSGREKDKLVFVNSACEGSVPFFVTRKVTNDKGQTTYYGEFDRYPQTHEDGRGENTQEMLFPKFHGRKFNVSDAGWRNRDEEYPVEPLGCDGDDISFVITGKDGKKITQIGSTYFVPNGYKVVKISPQDIERYKLERYERDRTGKSYDQIHIPKREPNPDELASPQTLADVELQLFKSGMLTEIQPITDGIEYWIKTNGEMGRPMRKLAALQTLIIDHQLREPQAASMLKQATKNGAPKYLIKKAQGGQPYGAPAIPEPMMTSDPTIGGGVPLQYPMTDLLTVGSDTEHRGESQMDMDATFRAQQAAQQGQKEVMDTSVVSGLIKTMDVDTVVDNYIGDLMLGLDRVGRILFMFYWHWDKFKERYGQQDMPELEDNLKNVFDNLGDLTIFLKQKTIEPDVSGAEAESDLEPVI
jgi:hypothetical protein